MESKALGVIICMRKAFVCFAKVGESVEISNQSQLTDKICSWFLTSFLFPKTERERELPFIWNSMRGFVTIKK